jgi:UDP-N-acetylglucosamine 2-epimerase (non-hydrolysing)
MKILHIVGNRPQFIKLAAFLKAAGTRRGIRNIIVHSGQHYDYEMSKVFFEELGIGKVSYNLEVGSGSHGFQTGHILARLDPVLLNEKPGLVVVYGDTNTTLAGALAAYKLHIATAHVESGMRENIWRPEEMNKKMADHCSDYCFCPIKRACLNLNKEGIDSGRIFFTGDITYDSFLMNKEKAMAKKIIRIPKDDFILMTMHRAETVDSYDRVKGIIQAILEIPIKVIYPIHPRTRKRLSGFDLLGKIERAKNIVLTKPVGYFEFLKLLLLSKMVVTDSSGVLKEAFYAAKPCVTADDTTEYREIFDMGYNILAGTKKSDIKKAVISMYDKKLKLVAPDKNPLGQGDAAVKMLSIITARI